MDGYRFDGDQCVPDDAKACPVVDLVTDWTEWTICSASCGGGTKTRTRICLTKKCGVSLDDSGGFNFYLWASYGI